MSRASPTVSARQIAFRLLKVRARSEKELRERLRLKKISSAIVDETIDYLKEKNLIDDRQFAKDWTNARLLKPLGLRRITFELKEKGIDAAIIQGELARVKSGYDEDALVGELAKKRAAKYKGIEKEKLKQRVFQHLAQRGFNIDSIQSAVKKL